MDLRDTPLFEQIHSANKCLTGQLHAGNRCLVCRHLAFDLKGFQVKRELEQILALQTGTVGVTIPTAEVVSMRSS
jgi:hypothetical protein